MWNPLTPPHLIAIRASVEEIDAEIAVHTRSITAARARSNFRLYLSGDVRRRNAATIALLERKLSNLREARRLWVDDFRRTEGKE